MYSFTKDIVNTHSSKWRPKLKKSEHYIYNKFFDDTWGISRQRICEAVDKLGAVKLIQFKKVIGKSTLVKLNE